MVVAIPTTPPEVASHVPFADVNDVVDAKVAVRRAPTDDDALEMNPPSKVERLLAKKVLDALRAPDTLRLAPTDDDALDVNPPKRYETPAPSMAKRSVTPSAVDEEILNFPLSLMSRPMVQS